MRIKFLIIALVIIILYGCSNSVSPSKKEFGIYLLQDTLTITSEAKQQSIESLQLQSTPIISIDDIIEYDWEEHVISLKPEALERFKNVEKKVKSVYGLPFVVVANREKIYLGNIYPMYSSCRYDVYRLLV